MLQVHCLLRVKIGFPWSEKLYLGFRNLIRLNTYTVYLTKKPLMFPLARQLGATHVRALELWVSLRWQAALLAPDARGNFHAIIYAIDPTA